MAPIQQPKKALPRIRSIKIRLTQVELESVKQAAAKADVPVAQLARDFLIQAVTLYMESEQTHEAVNGDE